MTNMYTSVNRIFAQNCSREVIFLGNMQANYISYKSTFIIKKTLPQIMPIVKQIKSIFKILVHTLSNPSLDLVFFSVITCCPERKIEDIKSSLITAKLASTNCS